MIRRLVSLNPTVRCIGVASRFGAPFSTCDRGPEALRRAGLLSVIRHNGLAAEWMDIAIPKASTAAMTGPAFTPKVPALNSGQMWMP